MMIDPEGRLEATLEISPWDWICSVNVFNEKKQIKWKKTDDKRQKETGMRISVQVHFFIVGGWKTVAPAYSFWLKLDNGTVVAYVSGPRVNCIHPPPPPPVLSFHPQAQFFCESRAETSHVSALRC